MVPSIVKMNRSDEGPMSHGIKYLFVLQIFRFEKMTSPWLFFQKMGQEKLYKNCKNKSLLTSSNSVSDTQNEQVKWQFYVPP
jgi:hypothetical protein